MSMVYAFRNLNYQLEFQAVKSEYTFRDRNTSTLRKFAFKLSFKQKAKHLLIKINFLL